MGKMAAGSTEKQSARRVYGSLQALCCPLVEDLYLQEDDSMLELLCSPSALRTDILKWICRRISPRFGALKGTSAESQDPGGLEKGMALIGQELMLCRADDLDLIKGEASTQRQLCFLEQLISVATCSKESASAQRGDAEALLSELFSAENTPGVRRMLQPTLEPWPPHMEAMRGVPESAQQLAELPDVSDLLKAAQAELEQLQSKCALLSSREPSSSSALRLAAGDLRAQMTTFSRLYEADLRALCSRETPSFSADPELFQRVHCQLVACNTELEVQRETVEACGCVTEAAKRLQAQPRYWSRGQKLTLPDQLEDITKRVGSVVSQLNSSSSSSQLQASLMAASCSARTGPVWET